METIEYRHKDKSKWPKGEWLNEYDKKQWLDPETGYPCLIVRGFSNGFCGYVGVPEAHPSFGKHYDIPDVYVHGGLTFADYCQEDKEHGVCHIVEPGESDRVWWLGFDCAHYNDLCPGPDSLMDQQDDFPALRGIGGTYRNAEWVENEVRDLAKQLKGLESAVQ